MNNRNLQTFVSVIGIIALVAIFAAYITAADCPSGQVAVRNIWNWPVCIAGAP